jgi:hypothetical protein
MTDALWRQDSLVYADRNGSIRAADKAEHLAVG